MSEQAAVMPASNVIDQEAEELQADRRRRLARWGATAAALAALVVYFSLSSRPVPVVLEDWGRDFETARAEAVDSGRLMLVAFESDDCPPCVQMDKSVLSADIIKSAVKNFVPVRVDAFSRRDLMNRYEVTGTPTYAVIDREGRMLNQAVWFQPVDEFLRFLHAAQVSAASAKDSGHAAAEATAQLPPSETRPEPGVP